MQNDYLSPVIDAPTTDFPFVAEMPKRERSKLVKLWDAFREMTALQAEHGLPVPRSAAAALLEISPQRIDQLVEAGKLNRVEFHGHPYITENSLVAHARSERKNGRPQKVIDDCASSPSSAWKVAKEFAKK